MNADNPAPPPPPPHPAPIDPAVLVHELNEQVLRAWETYIKFHAMFVTVNLAALAAIVQFQPPLALVIALGLTFLSQNGISSVTAAKMSIYSVRACAACEALGAAPLTHFGPLGLWGGTAYRWGHWFFILLWLGVMAFELWRTLSAAPATAT